jgi:hypothetical protein
MKYPLFRKVVFIAAVAVAAISFGSIAQAGIRLSAVGAGSTTRPMVKSVTGTTFNLWKYGYGGGLLGEIGIGPRFGFELGAFYSLRKFGMTVSGTDFDMSAYYAEVPVLVRYWLGRYIGLGAGGYVASGVGDMRVATGGVSAISTFGDNSFKRVDYGLVGSLQIDIPMGSSAGLIFDGRYQYGLANVLDGAAAGSSIKYTDIVGLVGIRFGGARK